jgi:PRTRC genetic system ThiF family protein
MRIEHTLPPDLLRNRAIRVLVIGAGGTGSAIVMGLPYLDQAMRVWGHRYGLNVAMMDADAVSRANCVRQPFSASDIGQNKATVLINRINLFWGTSWSAIPNHFHARSFDRNQDRCPDLVIGCVDTRAARKAIEDSFSRGVEPDLLLARPRQQCGQWTVHSWSAVERAQSQEGGKAAHGERIISGDIG